MVPCFVAFSISLAARCLVYFKVAPGLDFSNVFCFFSWSILLACWRFFFFRLSRFLSVAVRSSLASSSPRDLPVKFMKLFQEQSKIYTDICLYWGERS